MGTKRSLGLPGTLTAGLTVSMLLLLIWIPQQQAFCLNSCVVALLTSHWLLVQREQDVQLIVCHWYHRPQ